VDFICARLGDQWGRGGSDRWSWLFFLEADAGALAVLSDENHAGLFEGFADGGEIIGVPGGWPVAGLHAPKRWHRNIRRGSQVRLAQALQDPGGGDLATSKLSAIAHNG
jgi:hypothetical protein